jgi:hypothetical protein
MISLPIPYESNRTYIEVGGFEPSIASMVEDLSVGKLHSSTNCHLDPDLREAAHSRGDG